MSNFHAALGSLQGGAPLDNVDPERLVWEGMVLHLMGSKVSPVSHGVSSPSVSQGDFSKHFSGMLEQATEI